MSASPTPPSAGFRCPSCGDVDRVHFVEKVPTWYDVENRDGVFMGLAYTREYGDDGDDARVECPTCCGPVTWPDGRAIDLSTDTMDWE